MGGLSDKMVLRSRLRLGMGKGVKPNLLAIFIEKPRAAFTVTELTDRVSYTASTVRRALKDLVLADFVDKDKSWPGVARYSMPTSRSIVWKKMLGVQE
jgi:Fic family protein